MLRSEESPQQLNYRVDMPAGASLLQDEGSGAVQIVKEGAVLATVAAPSAQDAAGNVVPVSMSVSGDIVSVDVNLSGGSYLYPIEVDPEFNVKTEETARLGPWLFEGTSGFTYGEGWELWLKHPGGYAAGQTGAFSYRTNGDSRLYEINTKTAYGPTVVKGGNSYYELNAEAVDDIEFAGAGGWENSGVISGPQTEGGVEGFKSRMCAHTSECSPANGSEHNLVRLAMTPTGPRNAELLELRLYSAAIAISQPKETHSTVRYESGPAELASTTNVFHGAGAWLGPHSGAFEFLAEDLGLGVSGSKVEYDGKSGWELLHTRSFLGESACVGVQCAKAESETFSYESLGGSKLPSGEDKIRVAADDAMAGTWSSEHGEGEATLKVDSTPPHGLALTGLVMKGKEFQLGEVEAHVKAEASDGEGSVKSSGIKQSNCMSMNERSAVLLAPVQKDHAQPAGNGRSTAQN